MTDKKLYIESFDLLRVIATFAIICIHTSPFRDFPHYQLVALLIKHACRFAVPVFFLMSGYLFTRSLDSTSTPGPHLRLYLHRLLILFAAWTAIYQFLPFRVAEIVKIILHDGMGAGALYWKNNIAEAINLLWNHPLFFLLEGWLHLWFLPALIMAITGLFFLIRMKKEAWIIPLAIILYLIGLLGQAYSRTPFGLTYLAAHFETHKGPFFSFLFVSLGWWVYRHKLRLPFVSCISLAAAGFTLHLLEMVILYCSNASISLFEINYLVGTVLFALGIFLAALSVPQWGKQSVFSNLAPYTLGIYLSHFLLIKNLNCHTVYQFFDPLVWQIVFPSLVFFTSFAFVFFLQRFPATRWLVTGKFR